MHPGALVGGELANAIMGVRNSQGGSSKGAYLYSGGFGSLVRDAFGQVHRALLGSQSADKEMTIWLWCMAAALIILAAAGAFLYIKSNRLEIRTHKLESKVELVVTASRPTI